jgi:chemotaxis protein histidine kinase CheA
LINEKKDWDQWELLSSLNLVKDLVHKYQNLGEEKLGWQLEHVTIKIPSQIGESVVEDLMKVMKTGLTEKQTFFLNRARSKLFDFCFTRFEDVVKDAFAGVDSMARDLKKMEPRIIVKGIRTVLKSAGVDLVHKVFVHLIRNSMDHGIEAPEERVRKQKNPQGTITVSSSNEDGGRLLVRFFDDGAGLNLERITQCAIRAGYILQGQELSDQEKAELIFYSGLTTKDTSSDISGRGVGMDAVRNFVRDQGGDVKIVLGQFCESGYISFQIQILMPETIHFQIDHDL